MHWGSFAVSRGKKIEFPRPVPTCADKLRGTRGLTLVDAGADKNADFCACLIPSWAKMRTKSGRRPEGLGNLRTIWAKTRKFCADNVGLLGSGLPANCRGSSFTSPTRPSLVLPRYSCFLEPSVASDVASPCTSCFFTLDREKSVRASMPERELPDEHCFPRRV